MAEIAFNKRQFCRFAGGENPIFFLMKIARISCEKRSFFQFIVIKLGGEMAQGDRAIIFAALTPGLHNFKTRKY